MMFVVVTGGGRVGAQLTTLLLQAGHKVRLIENRPLVLERLHQEIPTEVIFVGDPTLPATLETAGLADADVLAATLAEDAHNLAISSFARFHYNVPRDCPHQQPAKFLAFHLRDGRRCGAQPG